MILSTETLVIAGVVVLIFLVSATRLSVKHEGFFHSLYWTLKGITLITYHLLMFLGSFADAFLRGLLSITKKAGTKRVCIKRVKEYASTPKTFMSEKSLHNAVARYLERTCHVRAHINEPIPGLKGARRARRPDVWTQNEPSLDWLVGFWDAEGTSDRTPAISIVQKEQGVIEAIGDMFGGSVRAAGNYWRWTLRGEAARGLVEKIDARSHCSAKRDRMITNFGAPTYSEQNREKKREYDKKYQETTRERQKEYHRERYRRLSNEAKLLREVQSASSVD